jgi:hypothetical protein
MATFCHRRGSSDDPHQRMPFLRDAGEPPDDDSAACFWA